ncbi:GNAT family N-acetyltransferase [Kordia sp. YSTF-M3]|uniref:GNAT family N-acetyltransferase n=1 Tax=Kordia aestuariivivens TaxID=2759037 RepID=A0ABR7QE87_9FLAO|nr:GNAT family N-acetyltransferase [Kordia aestuariivivens]MBC8756884.1 GNAT family N-acetyltransferase [Kordia aestuariivivens]
MKEAKIRFIQKSDLKDLVHLCKLHADYEKSEYNTENKEQLLNGHLFSDRPSVFCLVVEYDNKLIGFATYMKQFSTWDAEFYIYMDCLFMMEQSRGFGIGESLVDRIKEEGAKNQCKQIQWQTPDFNVRAMKFYDRIGAASKTKERYFLEI